ncbi:rhodanese-like domain-containing protein [Paenibacillus xerothermodurans]|uniref:Rhodanese-like domain-containing protein n=1 Tax=Paenibacillus xerothermodurans TaxID=1977292 RepID=A0A2W1NDH8_PAEXE|nr:rhodanese-like domain-containing protein [Paenibacillus xerothermodurans]PZE22567.1 rhodanese-like domain-containing protein [Paenibacillus xerothermodurans]
MQTITPQQLKNRLNNNEPLHIIDVREPEEIATGMIAGAVSIPLGQIPERIDEIPRDKETILVCRGGNRSKRAYDFLTAQGFTNLTNMTGGMMEWEAL